MRDLPEKVGNKYKFITVSAKRCEMLQKGAKPKVDTDNMTKFTTVAMEEVLDGLIDFEMIADKDDEAPAEEVELESAADIAAEEAAEKESEEPAEETGEDSEEKDD